MTLADYLSAEKFPLTSQRGLSADKQFELDCHNFDELYYYQKASNRLTDREAEIWKELQEKIPALEGVRREYKESLKSKQPARG